MSQRERARGIREIAGLRFAAAAALAAALLSSGCAKEGPPRLGDYLKELEFDGPREKAAYVWLGRFNVPVAAITEDESSGTTRDPRWMRIRFGLSAETAPENESAVKAAARKAKGDLSDAILVVIRSSSAEELGDPRLGAIKARMTETARSLLGQGSFRQLVLSDLATEKL